MRAFKGVGLSTKILLLGAACVLLGELMVCVPAIARFRANWLEERIAAAYLATLVLDPDLAAHLTDPMQNELLRRTGVLAISVRGQFETEIVLGRIVPVDRVIDLDQRSTLSSIWDTLESLVEGGDRRLRVLGRAPPDPNTRIDVIVSEAPMWRATMRFSLMTLGDRPRALAAGGLALEPAIAADDRHTVAPAQRRSRQVSRAARGCRRGRAVPGARRRDRLCRDRARPPASGSASGAGREDPARRPGLGHDPDQPRPAQHPGDRRPDHRSSRDQRGPAGAQGGAATRRVPRPRRALVCAHPQLHALASPTHRGGCRSGSPRSSPACAPPWTSASSPSSGASRSIRGSS